MMLVNEQLGASQVETQAVHPSARALLRHWDTLRGPAAAPSRGQLELRPMAAYAGNLLIIERKGGYKWRLAGTRLCHLFRQELTGRDALAGLDSFEADVVRRLLDGVIDRSQPCLIRLRLTTSGGASFDAELLALPLLAKDGAMQVFGGLFPIEDVQALVYDNVNQIELAGVRGSVPKSARGARGFKVIQGGRAD